MFCQAYFSSKPLVKKSILRNNNERNTAQKLCPVTTVARLHNR